MDILISGYYGFKNSGDDTLLLSIIQQLRGIKKDIRLCVLSNNPKETSDTYNVPAVKRDNPFSLLRAVLSCKMLLVGGGTLIQDSTSTKSLLYYLFVIKLAALFGKKIMLYANGIGPLKPENHSITKKILNKTDIITLRDKMSADELEKIGVTKPEIKLLADCAFGLDADTAQKPDSPKNYFIASVRDSRELPENFCQSIAAACDYLFEKYGLSPVFVPFQKSKDLKICEDIISKMKCTAEIFDSECEISQLLSLIANARLCIGMRLHSLIYSVMCKTPIVGLVYDPKVCGFMEYIGQKNYLDIKSLDEKELLALLDNTIENEEQIRLGLEESLAEMQKKAWENSRIAIDLLNRKEK